MTRESSLVSAQWVEDNLDNPDIVLVEVDEDTTAYDKGHIKGAIKLDWTTDLQDQVRRDFVNKEQFEALLSSRGVGNDHTVVLYGGNNNWFAAYAYWYFKLYGHDDVKLLDGGRKKWELDSRELTDELPSRDDDVVHARRSRTAASAPSATRRVAAIGMQNLVDVRSPDEYAGRLLAPAHLPQEQAQRAGHIPTAANVPWSKAANDDGTFRSPTTSSRRSTPRPASTGTRTPSPTAASASAPRTRGSCSRSCSARTTSRTTTAPGPSTARSSVSRSRSATSPGEA